MNILFVCTGNTCRSPMAMAVLREKLVKSGISDVSVDSAGLMSDGSKISPNSNKSLEKIGINICDYRSKQLTNDMITAADLIIVMTENHKDILLQLGLDKSKIIVLNGGISDPFGGNEATYDNCLKQIINGIDILFEKGVFGDI